jgi:hypothetical protein
MANNYSVNLNGSSAFSATDHSDFKPTVFTVGGWVKTSVSGTLTIFQSYSYASSKVAGIRLLLYNGIPDCQVGKNTGNVDGTDYRNSSDVGYTTTCNDGAWHWVVATYDGSNIKMYLDSSLLGTQAWSGGVVYATTNYVRVGCRNDGSGDYQFFNGNLDEVFLVSGTAWDSTTVSNYYKKFILGATNLKAYYQFENNANDSSGNSHTLTTIGSPSYQQDVPFRGDSGIFFHNFL